MWVCVCAVAACCVAAGSATRYDFYRSPAAAGGARRAGDTRRIFGGVPVASERRASATALLDRYWTARCSGAMLAPRWALTAAHCVQPHLAYVRCGDSGRTSPAVLLYQHPDFKVEVEETQLGRDVTLLHHDIGLVGTRDDLCPPTPQALRALNQPVNLAAIPATNTNKELEVFGFGSTGDSSSGEQMFSTRLQLAACERGEWIHCACAVARVEPRGVCAGDSGGPVFLDDVQVGVTSMGPTECGGGEGGGDAAPGEGALSVFTALAPYAALLNATMRGQHGTNERIMYEVEADGSTHGDELSAAPAAARPSRLRIAAPIILCFILR